MHEVGPILVFDTDCVLCSGMVAFILAHEKHHDLRFAAAWSEEGSRLAERHGFSPADLDDTILLVTANGVLTRSDASLAVLRHLVAPWRWLVVLAALPRPWRDGLYSYVARRRYRWFGKRENCAVLPARERHRMIGGVGRPSR